MNREALTQLIRVLKKVPERQFHLAVWRTFGVKSGSCGFAACALGWAGVDPWFIERGFTCGVHGPVFATHGYYFCDYDAPSKLFEISLDDAYRLFHPDSYNSDHEHRRPKIVIDRVKELMGRPD